MKIIINCLTTWLFFIIFHIHHHISFLLLNPNHNQNLLSQSSSLLASSLYHKQFLLHANPINADGNNYRGDITEDEAFLWFDEALIYVRGGSGGEGSNTYRYGKSRQHLGPIGGSGGRGGNVVLVADSSLNTLLKFKGCASYKAENGQPGDINFLNGLYGQDCIIEVPLGTIIKDNKTNAIIHEIKNIHDKIIIANGGNGGIGNGANKNRNKNEKSVCISPERGEKKILKLELNLIADIGLIGVPNAGKSTLLDRITNAKPKIASYPFTTIVPNLGICNILNNNISYNQIMTVCDIPGLIENAHLGVGLGINFLKHIERCKMIIHVINGDSIDPVNDYITINNELKLFSIHLANKPQVVVLNKIDLLNVKNKQHDILMKLKQSMSHSRLVSISADKNIGVQDLIEKTWNFLNKIKYDEIQQKQQEQQQQQLTTDSISINSRSSSSSSSSSMNHNYDYHGTNHNYDDNMIIDIQAIKSSLQIFYLTNNKVLITGNAVINAMIDELYNIDSYYGSLDRFESLVDSIDLSNEIYKVITTNNNGNNDYDDDKIHKNIRNDRSRMVSNARYSYNLVNRVDDVEVIDKKVDNQLSNKIFNDTGDYKNNDIIVVFKTSTDQEVTMKLKNHKFTIL